MSWLSDLFRSHPKPTPIPVPPTPRLYDVTVEVFDGPLERDEKVPDAIVMLGSRQAVTDGAGNAHLSAVPAGSYALTVGATGFRQAGVDYVVPGPPARVSLERDVPAILPLTTDGPIFRSGGQPWRYQGVTGFPLPRLFTDGVDIGPFLDAFPRANVVRCFDYVTWPGTGWTSIGPEAWVRFLSYLLTRGKRCELVVLTGDEPDRVRPGLQLVETLCRTRPVNLLVEGGNEVRINNKRIDEGALRQMFAMCQAAGIPFSSGLYIEPLDSFGSYLTNHENRDFDEPRKIGHDLHEFYTGGGPSKPADPPHRVPCVANEPIRPDQLLAMWRDVLQHGYSNDERPDIEAWINNDLRKRNQDGLAEQMTAQDYLAAGGGCATMGAGGLFHFDGGKLGRLPSAFEARCANAFFDGLEAFPADLPVNVASYRRPVEKSLRTYVVGSGMVRVRPMTPAAPEPGWTPIGTEGILWKR